MFWVVFINVIERVYVMYLRLVLVWYLLQLKTRTSEITHIALKTLDEFGSRIVLYTVYRRFKCNVQAYVTSWISKNLLYFFIWSGLYWGLLSERIRGDMCASGRLEHANYSLNTRSKSFTYRGQLKNTLELIF